MKREMSGEFRVICLTDVAVIEICRFFRLNGNDLHGRPLRALTCQVGAWTKMVMLRYVSLYIDLIMTDVNLTTANLVYLTPYKHVDDMSQTDSSN